MTERGPLAAIEAEVLSRARELRLDPTSATAADQLRPVLDAVVRDWHDDYRRGLRPHDIADPEALTDRAMRNLTGYGPLSPLLADDDVWEIMVNAPDALCMSH